MVLFILEVQNYCMKGLENAGKVKGTKSLLNN